MEYRNKKKRSLVLKGVAKLLNGCGHAVVGTWDTGATSLRRVTRTSSRGTASAVNVAGRTFGTALNIIYPSSQTLLEIRGMVEEMKRECATDSAEACEKSVSRRISSRLISKYATQSAVFGGLTAVPGVLPGIGTLGVLSASLTADLANLLRIQIKLCYAVAYAYDVEMDEAELQAVVLSLLGLSGSAELFKGISARATREVVERTVADYQQAAAGKAALALSERTGLKLGSTSLKLIPLIGIPLNASVNLSSTMVVGNHARNYFSAWKPRPPRSGTD